MNDVLILVAIVAAWFVLQKYILPAFGVRTWMSDSCDLGDRGTKKTDSTDEKNEKQKPWSFLIEALHLKKRPLVVDTNGL